MYDFFISLFVASATFFGTPTMPKEEGEAWKITKQWDGGLHFSAEIPLSKIECPENNYLQLPLIQYGIHRVKLGTFERSFNTANQPKNVYSRPRLKCDLLVNSNAEKLIWEVDAYSLYYARVLSWPQVIETESSFQLSELFYVGSTFALFTLAFFMFVSFSSTSNRLMVYGITLSSLFFSFYFMLTQAKEFGIILSSLTTHKIADIFLIGGIFSLFYCYDKLGFSSERFVKSLGLVSLLSVVLVILGENGDQVQFGTTISYVLGIFGLIQSTGKSLKQTKIDQKLSSFAIFTCTFFLLAGSIIEAAIVGGSIESMSYFPLISLIAYTCFAISINQGIRATYNERDLLLNDMDSLIKEKTNELHKALEEKDLAQAELIQKEKLASLGTLSAGIAHEINNSINYINSCVIGLEKVLPTVIPEDHPKNSKIDKLISTARHGCKVTMEIVASLRNFTGLNQAKFKNVRLDDIIDSVTTIIRSKVGQIKIIKVYDPSIEIYCSPVGMNQVIMNLVTNAIDVVDPIEGEITISAFNKDDIVRLEITDNGKGIPKEKQQQIFDPFFTTKDVGKGTGLGLHIVHNEIVNRHGGKVLVHSEEGVGTTFFLEIPKLKEDQETKVA